MTNLHDAYALVISPTHAPGLRERALVELAQMQKLRILLVAARISGRAVRPREVHRALGIPRKSAETMLRRLAEEVDHPSPGQYLYRHDRYELCQLRLRRKVDGLLAREDAARVPAES